MSLSSPAAAHDVTTTLRGTGEAIVVFHYGDGSPMAEAHYAVFAPGGGVLPTATGLTDAAGTVRLAANADGVWRVDVHDAAGHASRARVDFRDGVAAMGGGGVPAWVVAVSLVANVLLAGWVARLGRKQG